MGLSMAALALCGVVANAQESNVADEATGQVTEAQNEATDAATDTAEAASEAATGTANETTDTASDTAGQAADTASDAAQGASDTAQSASSGAAAGSSGAPQTPPQPGQSQSPAGSASAGANINSQNPANVQGSAGAQSRLDAQGRPLPNTNLNGQAGAQSQLNTDLNTSGNLNPSQLNTQQSSQLQANGQLSAQAMDQRLGLQFDQTARTTGQGLTISSIQPNSVFFNSGLRQGDVLLSVDNRPFLDRAEFVRMISTYQQDRIPLVIMRNGQRQTIYFSRPADFVIHQHQPSQAILGVSFDSARSGGAVVRSVTPNSPAEHAGLMSGDVITGLNGKPILAAHEVVESIRAMAPGQEVTIDYARNQLQLRAETILVARTELYRHTVGYAPQSGAPPLPPAIDRSVIRQDTTFRAQPTNPGDPDGDGLRLDGDGRIPRRALNRR
jgi:PDZ domain-containing secreted protein